MTEYIRVRHGQQLELKVDKDAILDTLESIANEAVQEATTDINRGGRSGKFRPDGGRRSVVGEPPHTETGDLVRSLRVERDVESVKVGSSVEYAGALESGGRAFLGPAIEEAVENERTFPDIMKVRAK